MSINKSNSDIEINNKFLNKINYSIKSLFKSREMIVALVLIILIIVTWYINPLFLSPQSIKDLMLNSTIMIILAVGQSIVIITRNVDLSVGSILGLTAFGTGALFNTFPEIPIFLIFILGCLFGALLGFINALLVTKAKVPALVITLGTMYIFRGILASWAGSKQYFSGNNPLEFGLLSVKTIWSFPVITLISFIILAITAIYMFWFRTGRDFYAIGSSPDAANLFGINVVSRVSLAFIICGALSGLAGVIYTSRYNAVGALTGMGIELQVVAAVVVGGVAIFGGSGSVVGAALGAILLSTITSSLTAIHVDKFWQQAIVGVLIIAAIAIDRVITIRTDKKRRVGEV